MPRPFIDGALAFDRLDAASALAWFGLAAPKIGPTVPIDGRASRIPLFDDIDADLRLSATQLSGFGPTPGRLAMSVTAKSGLVIADIAELEIANGSGSGQITVDQRGAVPSYWLHGFVNHAEATQLLNLAQMPAFLSGQANLRFEMAGRGRTLDESAAATTGEVQISFPAGGRMPINAAGLLADARERKSFALSTHQRSSSAFDQFNARLAVRQGTIMSEHVAVHREGAAITADGTVQVRAGRVYLRLLTDHGQGLARSARLGRSQSVLIHGEVGNPTVMLEEAAGMPPPATAAGPPPPPPSSPSPSQRQR